MGFLRGLIMSAIMVGGKYCFKKLKTRKGTLIRFCILGVLCAFNLITTIILASQIFEFWWLILITTGGMFCVFVWRFVWDGVLLVKNNFDPPDDAPTK